MSDLQPTRREELLADGALAWLDDGDAAAFEALVRDPAARSEHAVLERTAATAALVCGEPEVAPDQVRLLRLLGRLEADARRHFAARLAAPQPMPMPGRPVRLWPWLVTAASLTVAWFAWRGPDVPPVPPPAEARLAMLQAGGATTCPWQPGPSPLRGQVEGDVVWNATTQEGFLRLRGLPPLGPDQRYQLWIVDSARNGPPVDGGLLALPPANGEAVVHVVPRLPVAQAAAFVLTVETARGVVVSAQEHVVAIAKP